MRRNPLKLQDLTRRLTVATASAGARADWPLPVPDCGCASAGYVTTKERFTHSTHPTRSCLQESQSHFSSCTEMSHMLTENRLPSHSYCPPHSRVKYNSFLLLPALFCQVKDTGQTLPHNHDMDA